MPSKHTVASSNDAAKRRDSRREGGAGAHIGCSILPQMAKSPTSLFLTLVRGERVFRSCQISAFDLSLFYSDSTSEQAVGRIPAKQNIDMLSN